MILYILFFVFAGIVALAGYSAYRATKRRENGSLDAKIGCKIVRSVPSHNTSPQLMEIFNKLDSALAEHQLELHVNLKGYVSDDK